MPYLQLDVNGHYPAEDRRRLAQRLCETYARLMDLEIERITVAIRQLDEGAIWRVLDGELTPVSMLMCDIRRGRSAEHRMAVAQALCQECIDILGLRRECLNVEFTQHSGDEMYHPALGGWSPEWAHGEGQASARG